MAGPDPLDTRDEGRMSQTRLLPLLPLDDTVLLPGMVVPLDLSDVREVLELALEPAFDSKPPKAMAA